MPMPYPPQNPSFAPAPSDTPSRIRIITTFLELLERDVRKHKEPTHQHQQPKYPELRKRNSGEAILHDRISRLSTLLERDVGRIAVMPVGRGLVVGELGVDVMMYEPRHDHKPATNIAQDDIPELAVKVVRPTDLPKAGDNMIRFVLERSVETTVGEGKEEKDVHIFVKDIGIAQYCAVVTELIRLCHEDGIPKGEKRMRERNAWAYVLLGSVRKILYGFERGRLRNCNLWDTFTSEKFTQASFLFHSSGLSNRLFTKKEYRALKFIFKRIAEHQTFSIADGGVDELLGLTENSFIYDVNGRRRFHIALRFCLTEAYASVKALSVVISNIESTDMTAKRKAGMELADAEMEATYARDTLARFVHIFSGILKAHCQWLQIVFDREALFNDSVYTKIPVGDIEEEIEPRIGTRGFYPREPADTNDEMYELMDLMHSRQGGWHVAADKFIRSTCLHHQSMFGLYAARSAEAQLESKCIRSMSFTFLEVKYRYKDQRMQTIESFLRSFWKEKILSNILDDEKKMEAAIEDLEVLIIRFRKWKSVESDAFPGHWHSESVLISLYMLMNNVRGDEIVSPCNMKKLSETLRKSYNCDIGADVLDHCKDIGNIFAASKRCCPACTLLMESLNQQKKHLEKPETLRSEKHVSWSAIALPPWLPQQEVSKVLQAAEEVLLERLQTLARRKRLKKELQQKQRTCDDEDDLLNAHGRFFDANEDDFYAGAYKRLEMGYEEHCAVYEIFPGSFVTNQTSVRLW